RPAASEQRGFQWRHAGILRLGPWSAEHDQIEDAAVAADEGIVRKLLPRPAIGKDRRPGNARRHAMGLHEGFELGACLRRAVTVEGARDPQTADRLDPRIS